jgi:glycosyltransferase involved in cell wall biosynthesis
MTLAFIGNDASLTGAPYTQLYLLQWLRANTDYSLEVVLLYGGPLVAEFAKVAKVHVLNVPIDSPTPGQRVLRKLQHVTNWRARQIIKEIQAVKPSLIFANTMLTLEFGVKLKQALQVPLLLCIHELETAFFYFSADDFRRNSKQVDFFIPVSQRVQQYYETAFDIPADKTKLVYDFAGIPSGTSTAADVRKELGLKPETRLVAAVGSLNWRKGADLFLQVANQAKAAGHDNLHFAWVGANSKSLAYKEMKYDIERMGLADYVSLVGIKSDMRGYFEALEVLLLTSREDPFPLVCMEAALMERPIICFAQAGGMPEFVRDDAGFVVPYADVQAMAEKAVYLLQHDSTRIAMGKQAQQRAEAGHTIKTIGPQMHEIIRKFLP